MPKLKIFLFCFVVIFFVSSEFLKAQRVIPTGRAGKIDSKNLQQNKIIKRKFPNNNIKDNNEPERNRLTRKVKYKERIKPFPKKKIRRPSQKSRKQNIDCIDQNYSSEYIIDTEEEQTGIDDNAFFQPIEKEEIFNPYPNFPLQFINGKITYSRLYCDYDDDARMINLYNLKFEVKVINDDYIDLFGVLLEYSDGEKQLELFNEIEKFLYWNKTYTFSKEIEIHQNGYIKLKIGYFDSDNNSFYPAINNPNKTNLLVYVVGN